MVDAGFFCSNKKKQKGNKISKFQITPIRISMYITRRQDVIEIFTYNCN